MSGQAKWFNRAISPTVIVLIGAYGLWDVVVQPFMAGLKKPPAVCQVVVAETIVAKPGDHQTEPSRSPSAKESPTPQSSQEPIVPAALPIVVPVGKTLTVTVQVTNPDDQPVTYTWEALRGQINPRWGTHNWTTYTAPLQLVDDLVSVRITSPGCIPVRRSKTIAIVPAASPSPLPSLPVPSDPLGSPLPLPSLPGGEPSPEEPVEPRF
jgi:hypothetical protein